MLDNYHNIKVVQLLEPTVKTADTNSGQVDVAGYEAVTLIGEVGTMGDTLSGAVKIEYEVEHSDDSGSNFVDCADTEVFNAVTGTNTGCFAVIDGSSDDSAAYYTGYKGNKRYVRVVANFTGSHVTGTPISAVALVSVHVRAQQPRNESTHVTPW